MKAILFSFIPLIIQPAFTEAQELKRIRNQTLYDYEEYYVQKEDKKMREGKYFKLTQYKVDTLVSGRYIRNMKSGVWRYFERGSLIGQGAFDADKKIGVWEYFENGRLITKYNHTVDSILFYETTDHEYEIVDAKGNSLSKLFRAPIYIGFYPLMYEQLVYPMRALRMGIFGKVLVSFVVNADGTTGDYRIEKDILEECGTGLVNALKTTDRGWLPGLLNNNPVSVRMLCLGEFQLMDNGDKAIKIRLIN